MGLNLSQTGQDHVFQLIADVTNDLQFITPNIGKEFYVELRPSSTQYVDIMENIDDETVTDIVPSFMASEAIELSASGVQVEHLDVTDVTVVN